MLSEWLLRTFFGRDDPPGELSIGLFDGDREISVGGYRRTVVERGGWTVTPSSVRARAMFSPVAQPTRTTAGAVLSGSEVVEMIPHVHRGERVEIWLSPGMVFQYDALIELERDP